MAVIRPLVDRKTGEVIYPTTKTKCVYDDSGKSLKTILEELEEFGGGTGGSGSIIYVSTSETTLISKEVTATCGDHISKSKFDSNGKATLVCPWSGTTTISSTDGTDVADGIVNLAESFGSYEIAISFYELYGFRKNMSDANPATRIEYLSGCDNAEYTSAKMNYSTGQFEYGDWENAFFIANLKPCMVKYDGTVDYELDKNDYSKKTDGTASDVANTSYGGNAMMGIPTVWVKCYTDNGYQYVYICSKQLDSSYKAYAHINSDGNIIPYAYMRIYEGSLVDSKLRSISGQSVRGGDTATTEITYAKNNNLNNDTIWNTGVLADWLLIQNLLYLIGKSTDTQTVFGNGNIYNRTSTAESLIPTGTMNDKGLFYGSDSTTTHVGVKVFGMENWWANKWERIAGWINVSDGQKIKLTYGTQDGSTVTGYNTDGSGYITVNGANNSSNGYISSTVTTDYGMIPNGISGSTTTYECDYMWTNNTQTNYAFVGGRVWDSLGCGASCVGLHLAPASCGWGNGASLSLKNRE